jgi:hypothetical protein
MCALLEQKSHTIYTNRVVVAPTPEELKVFARHHFHWVCQVGLDTLILAIRAGVTVAVAVKATRVVA